MKKINIIGGCLLLILIVLTVGSRGDDKTKSSNSDKTVTPTTEINRKELDIVSPDSIYVLVNKNNPLPVDYVPTDLRVPGVALRLNGSEEQMQIRDIVAKNLDSMFATAQREGINLVLSSGYRSSALQSDFFNRYVSESGLEAAEKFSARPGYSEHQSGLAVDIINAADSCSLEECFAVSPEGIWLKNNAHKFGFILRYLPNKYDVTGYNHEPWHFRYVGIEISQDIHDQGITLEEYYQAQ
jgi:zinc D-Ala-D-Ala carboxypeptidase